MQLNVKVKQPGRKQALVDKIIHVDGIDNHPNASQLISAIVSQQVMEYNNKPFEKNLLPFLSKAETDEKAATGKIGFGSIYNENKADVIKAQETALQAFKDGMYAIFVDDVEVTSLEQTLTFTAATVITFIRLVFLAGSYW